MNRTLLAIAVSALLTIACGDSSEDDPVPLDDPDNASTGVPAMPAADPNPMAPLDPGGALDVPAGDVPATSTDGPAAGSEPDAPVDAVSEVSGPETGGSETSDPDPASGAGPDPEARNTARVDYDLTVPAYVSDALQVRLVRGEDDVVATWNGDEFRSASEELPTGTETAPVVTFLDDDGGITLGTAELVFRTGTNAAQSVEVSAGQFDTARWDDDRDGVSNLDESIAGTDPRVDDREGLERRETFSEFNAFARPDALEALGTASALLETSMPATLPYQEEFEEDTKETFGYSTPRYTTRTVIDLDASGTGRLFQYDQDVSPSENTMTAADAARSNVDGVITWMGTYREVSGSAGVTRDYAFDTEFSVVDATTRRQQGVIEYDSSGLFSRINLPITLSHSLTGTVIDGTPDCEPVAGTNDYTDCSYEEGSQTLDRVIRLDTAVTKNADDEYWRVTTKSPDGETLSDFLVRSLSTDFHCDFAL